MRIITLRSIILLVLAATLTLGSAAHAQKLLWQYRVVPPEGFTNADAVIVPIGEQSAYVGSTGAVVFQVRFDNEDGTSLTRLISLTSKGEFIGTLDLFVTNYYQVAVVSVGAVTPTTLSVIVEGRASDESVDAIGDTRFLKSYKLNKSGQFIESGSVNLAGTGNIQGIEPNRSAGGYVLFDDFELSVRRYSAF